MSQRVLGGAPQFIIDSDTNRAVGIRQPNGDNEFLPLLPSAPSDATVRALLESLGVWRVLAASAVAVSHTGDTDETPLAEIAIPAGAMGAKGILSFTGVFTGPSSANNKTWRLRLGGIGGTEFANFVLTTNSTGVLHRVIWNRDDVASQVSMALNSSNGLGVSTVAPATGAIDMASAQDLVVSCELASAAETVTLESYKVEVLYQA